jgi:hypothetical protein
MSAQLAKKFKRADPSRAELATNRASRRAASILSSPTYVHHHHFAYNLPIRVHLAKIIIIIFK